MGKGRVAPEAERLGTASRELLRRAVARRRVARRRVARRGVARRGVARRGVVRRIVARYEGNALGSAARSGVSDVPSSKRPVAQLSYPLNFSRKLLLGTDNL